MCIRDRRYRNYWGKKGGITVSGGEPLRQLDFLTEFFTLARAKGVHTALDTAGQPFRPDDPAYLAAFDRLMANTSLVILDLKEIDPERHRQLTGKDNANILAMARHISDLGIPLWVRHVLVPGLTDDEEGLRKTADFIRSLKTVQRVVRDSVGGALENAALSAINVGQELQPGEKSSGSDLVR